ncbi:hypothetical protein CYLTODRAFT_363518 [Cylindrobasidium torrendii FP15055 ss-10]|uniref:DDE Tnp4 domain-containing protein n=1 Tax=Cylindrobasidium torrendii FP15055 ss-10 TaxID=1314674 RepID=A0A0D7ARI3_9AGAR|nr:hypothetical protein CYLTODRAFT_363518 [Cylindrobasidium torrendii FP15055 ss-10]
MAFSVRRLHATRVEADPCLSLTAGEIIETARALEIPETFSTSSRYSFTSIEAFALTLARFAHGEDQYSLANRYRRPQSAISEAINFVVTLVNMKWHHLLDFDDKFLLSPSNLTRYADAVHRAGAPARGVWGFIDCTIRRICRPKNFQEEAYNGYKKYHALKYQGVMLPCGIIANLYGPLEGRRNDNQLLADSHILDHCAQKAFRNGTSDSDPIEWRCLQLYGDPAYGLDRHIMCPYSGVDKNVPENARWNSNMSKVRMAVEHAFGLVSSLWHFVDEHGKMQLFSSPVGHYYRFAVLMTNIVNCYRPNPVAQRFCCNPPSLQEYLHH